MNINERMGKKVVYSCRRHTHRARGSMMQGSYKVLERAKLILRWSKNNGYLVRGHWPEKGPREPPGILEMFPCLHLTTVTQVCLT